MRPCAAANSSQSESHALAAVLDEPSEIRRRVVEAEALARYQRVEHEQASGHGEAEEGQQQHEAAGRRVREPGSPQGFVTSV